MEDLTDSLHKALPISSAPWISARAGPVHYSVSARPDILEALLASAPFAGRVVARLPIRGPYHAPHLFASTDVDRLLRDVSNDSIEASRPPIPIVSCMTGEVMSTRDFADTLRVVASDCLIATVRWDLVYGACALHLRAVDAGEAFLVCPVAASFPDKIKPGIQACLDKLPRPTTPLLPTTRPQVRRTETSYRHTRLSKAKIAVVGISGRFPQSGSMDAFWDLLVHGIDTHELVPASRWDHRTHVQLNPTSKNTSGTGFGCWLHDAAAFDARFFNMSPREAPQVDPAQRMALLCAAEALDQAGIVPDRSSSTQKPRVGVYFGCTSNDWMETNSAQDIDTYFIPGGNRAFIPGRINYHFKFSGPSYTIDTACSSSLTAIHLACNALWRGEVDTAIIGGTNVLTNPDMTAGLDRGHFLSRTGNCKTFDESADGYCRGEAVVTAVFKRLDDAIQDRDPIQACILSVATNHSAESDSITRPHVGAQQALIESVLADAGVDANSISYVEMHGTGTQAGDAAETASVLESLAPKGKRQPHQPLHIGAAKANVGHGEAAAGVTSLAKVLLMLKHSKIPPHCGIQTRINPKIPDLKSRNTFIAKTPVNWQRPVNGVRRVLLNNFSAAGGNTALVLEDPPHVEDLAEHDPRSHHVVAISAKTPWSLQQNLRNLISWIDTQQPSGLSLGSLSYTTTARRSHYPHRVAVSGKDATEIRNALQASLDQGIGANRHKGSPRLIFTFTGQGSHFAGMGSDLYKISRSFRLDIQRMSEMCEKAEFLPILSLFEDATAYESASPTTLQLTTVCLQMALYRLWTAFGVKPSVVVGHSLGEYPALYAAGVLSQADVIHLVGGRGQLLEKTCKPGTHSMLAVRSAVADLTRILGLPSSNYEISCINGHQSTVVGALKPDLQAAKLRLTEERIASTELDVSYAFHTAQVDPILDSLADLARGVKFSPPKIAIISPAYGKVFREGTTDIGPDFVAHHCRTTVDMAGGLHDAKIGGVIDWQMACVEIGPAVVVGKMVKEVLDTPIHIFASMGRNDDIWKLMSQALSRLHCAGMTINWNAYHEDVQACHKVLELPSYSWELKDYWMQYEHSWSLRKGDPPLRVTMPELKSSSIHEVLEDTLLQQDGELIIQADLSRKDLHPMVQGHKVYGVPLCTPSVYADIALTVGEYLIQCLPNSSESQIVEVADMNIQSALVANSEGVPQLLRTAVKRDKTHNKAVCTFSSVDSTGKVLEQHAHCSLHITDAKASQEKWQACASALSSRMRSLEQKTGHGGNTFRFSRSMIYKMVSQLADFDPNYRGLMEITLDNDTLEATGRVSFENIIKDGAFHTNPAYIDALSQLGGFVMNANERVDLDKEVFVNHGWGSLQLFDPIDADKTYRSYVKMSEGKDKLWTGDIVIFDNEKIVAVFAQVALQCVPRRLMEYIVNTASKRVSSGTSSVIAKAGSHGLAQVREVTRAVDTSTQVTVHPTKPGLVATALKILSDESGIAIEDLTDDSSFDEIGMDSLLCLMVNSKLRDELNIDLDSAKFLELGTVGRLTAYLRQLEPSEQTTVVSEIIQEEVITTKVSIESTIAPADGIWTQIINVISEESGVIVQDLTYDTCFNDIGIDSLLSLLIWSRLRDEVGLELEHTSPFLEFDTIGKFKTYITGAPEAPCLREDGESRAFGTESPSLESDTSLSPPESPFSESNDEPIGTPDTEISNDEYEHDLPKPSVDSMQPLEPAWSLVLQGSPRLATEKLFLFPDGCGAATSYLRLPRISATTAVIAFNSPFMKNPHEMAGHDLQRILSSYIASVRRHQPHGPYHLGGWSAGGILAYAIAQRLIADGESIATLQLIDSPAPTRGLDRLPDRFFDHCSSVGIFGSELATDGGSAAPKVPDWLMPHFRATIEMLHDYRAPPMAVEQQPKVSIIWAGSSAFDGGNYAPLPAAGPADEETGEGMAFLTEKRKELGPGEWARLFPGQKIRVHALESEHHFSMMRGEGAKQLSALIKDSICGS
jgi:iterative type I PKS product template protein